MPYQLPGAHSFEIEAFDLKTKQSVHFSVRAKSVIEANEKAESAIDHPIAIRAILIETDWTRDLWNNRWCNDD